MAMYVAKSLIEIDIIVLFWLLSIIDHVLNKHRNIVDISVIPSGHATYHVHS